MVLLTKSAFSLSHSAHPFLAWASVAYSAVHFVATGLMAWVQLGYMFVPKSVEVVTPGYNLA